jgi:hypothetical protein
MGKGAGDCEQRPALALVGEPAPDSRGTATGTARLRNRRYERCLTDTPLAEALPALLRERRMTRADLAAELSISTDVLRRALSRREGHLIELDLAFGIERALGLPAYYFPESRAAWLVEELRHRPRFADRIHSKLGGFRGYERESVSVM